MKTFSDEEQNLAGIPTSCAWPRTISFLVIIEEEITLYRNAFEFLQSYNANYEFRRGHKFRNCVHMYLVDSPDITANLAARYPTKIQM